VVLQTYGSYGPGEESRDCGFYKRKGPTDPLQGYDRSAGATDPPNELDNRRVVLVSRPEMTGMTR
jgi:hypothetical protein